jgi:SpoVK/Ycf46/Vps4 family AAA+-type ATPase
MEAIISDSQRVASQGSFAGFDRNFAHASAQDRIPQLVAELVYDMPARRKLAEMVLPPELVTDLKEFLDEYSHASLLRAHSLEPRHTVLMVGPPGNGKTTLAEVIATELSLPLLFIRYDAIVDSFLGETSNRLRRLIDWAALNPCVLFFDEFDTVGKERSDAQETGEIKRVVSTLLMQMDRLPSHAVIVCATNHPELLDRAVWRRFQLRLPVNKPTTEQLNAWFSRFSASLEGDPGISAAEFAKQMLGENMSEVEAFTTDVRRQLVLSQGRMTASEAVKKVLSRMQRRLRAPTEEGDNGNAAPIAKARKRAARSSSTGEKRR